jgi:hypothetical protein
VCAPFEAGATQTLNASRAKKIGAPLFAMTLTERGAGDTPRPSPRQVYTRAWGLQQAPGHAAKSPTSSAKTSAKEER